MNFRKSGSVLQFTVNLVLVTQPRMASAVLLKLDSYLFAIGPDACIEEKQKKTSSGEIPVLLHK